jgi:glycosyltransferase involved in cell wall biosynthesis
MSCSIAVVTTPTGIGCNLINDVQAKICGFNRGGEMYNAIDNMISDPSLRTKIAFNGYCFAKKFIWKKQVMLLEEKYQQWLT